MFGLDQLIIQGAQVFSLLGYLIFFVIIFAESGLFFGFFLPGDSLIFTLGLLCSQEILNVWLVMAVGIIAAISGDTVGYLFGKKVGPKLFNKEDSLFFKKEYINKARSFYDKYGVKTIVLARFTPIVRTFAPIVAGATEMHYPTFAMYNAIGGISWIISMTLAGYYLGQVIPNIDKYVLPIGAFIVVASVIPSIVEVLKNRKK